VAKLFFCYERPYCTDPYSPYGFGMKIKATLGMDFEVDFIFLLAVSRQYGTVRTTDWGHGNRGTVQSVR
jgi:hypothetical protein